MIQLVPHFILEKHSVGQTKGAMEAVTLFIDISGFTALTESLMANGRIGAEVLADTLQAIFTPLVEAIYARNGFVASFAGDALIALFPIADEFNLNPSRIPRQKQVEHGSRGESWDESWDESWKENRNNAIHYALLAAWEVKEHMMESKEIQTEFGLFHFAIKISLAWGMVEWLIWRSQESERLKQPCAYAFLGDAIDQAIASDSLAKPEQIVLNQDLCNLLPPYVNWTPLEGGSGLLKALNLLSFAEFVPVMDTAKPSMGLSKESKKEPTNDQRSNTRAPANMDPETLARLADFYPSQLLESQLQGEFRPVVSLFLGIQSLPVPGTKEDPIPLILKLLHQYDGFLCRVDRSNDNNRLLIFWGAPVSHENNLERALEFCLAIKRNITIPIRAGITYQIGYAGFIGATQRAEYTCYGSHVNLAARQMFTAPWGEIWLDQDTAQRISHTFDISPIGDLRFKGFLHSQSVFMLQGLRSTPAGRFFNGEICGRELELHTLKEAVQPIFAGKFAGIIGVTGEAGIGKSRLLYELIQSIQQREPNVELVHSQSDEILRHSLNPFRYHLRSYFGQTRSATQAKNKANFNAKLDALLEQFSMVDSPGHELASEIDRTRSALGAILDLHWEGSFYEQLEPQLRFENTLTTLKNFLLVRALLAPLVLLIEDAQWLDDDSLGFLQRLFRNIETFPIAVLISSRRGIEIEAVPLQVVPLQPLHKEATQALAMDRLGVTLLPEQAEQLVERTEGNPLFIEQLLLYLQDNDLLFQQKSDLLLPDDAQAVLVARLDRLTEEIRQVVQTAAVLGREFDVPILSRILGDDHDIQTKVRQATDESIWYSMNELRYLFRHTLLREAAYGMQLRARLRHLHATAATAIETLYSENLTTHYGEIAYHYEMAGKFRKALDYSYKAGQIAKENYKNREALEHYERMLKYLKPEKQGLERLNVLQKQAEVLRFTDRYEEALAALEEAAKLGADLDLTIEVGKISISMGSIQVLKGEFEKAESLLLQGISVLQTVYAHAELGLAYRELGNVWEGLGDYDRASAYYQQALEAYELGQDPSGKARTLIGLGIVAWNEGAFKLAEELYKQSRRIFEELNDQYNAAIANTNLANVALVRKDWGTARAYYESSLETFRQCGNTMSQAAILGNLGIVYYNIGDYAASRECNLASYTINWEIGSVEGAIYNKINLANIAIMLDDVNEAALNIQAALQLSYQLRSPRLMLEALLPSANFYQAIAEPEKALFLCAIVRMHPATHAYLQEMFEPIESELAVDVSAGIRQQIEDQTQNVSLDELVIQLSSGNLQTATILSIH
ncbi:MAG: tetratricopeptide repeat protein [Chloroflexota bacterium]